jgi:hypothetical protein
MRKPRKRRHAPPGDGWTPVSDSSAPAYDYDREACLIAEVANLSRGELKALSAQEWRPLAERVLSRRGLELRTGGADWKDLCAFHAAVHDSVVAIAEGGAWRPRRRTAQDWPTYRECGDLILVEWESTSDGTPGSREEANIERFLSMRGRWPFAHCPECGRLFVVRSVAKFCSKSCGRKTHRERWTPAEKAKRAAYMRDWRKASKTTAKKGTRK